MTDGLDAIFSRKPPTEWEKFRSFPSRYLAEYAYSLRKDRLLAQRNPSVAATRNNREQTPIKVVCLSDTHNHIIPDVPDGDILIHAGDLTERGTIEEVQRAVEWLQSLPHRYKVVIAGNHELCLDANYKGTELSNGPKPDSISWGNINYLQQSEVILPFPEKERYIKVYGSPYTPKHGNSAFQYPRPNDVWSNSVPIDTDILVTHGPPRHHLDIHAGCQYLLREVRRVKPSLHVFGHIHVGYGRDYLEFDSFEKAYERCCAGTGGLLDIITLLWNVLLFSIIGNMGIPKQLRENTVIINASMVRGLKNEKLNGVLTEII